jgi:hypothetical protein
MRMGFYCCIRLDSYYNSNLGHKNLDSLVKLHLNEKNFSNILRLTIKWVSK